MISDVKNVLLNMEFRLDGGRTRRESISGRSYIVAPATIIVPGVLNGSQGRLFYPSDEISKNVDAWNGMPLTLAHPTENGKPVSARLPVVSDKYDLGRIYNTRFDGKLRTEAWFDEQLLRDKGSSGNQIRNALLQGKPLELSTGLFTDNYRAPKGANWNGRPYDFVARNYRPDHLAVLLDQPGACSLKDGCGVLVNACGGKKTKNEKESCCEACATKNKKDDLRDACWDGYEAIGTKVKDGKSVPNCVPKTKNRRTYRVVENAFCPTGAGGGQDNSCSAAGKDTVATTPNKKSWKSIPSADEAAKKEGFKNADDRMDKGFSSKTRDTGKMSAFPTAKRLTDKQFMNRVAQGSPSFKEKEKGPKKARVVDSFPTKKSRAIQLFRAAREKAGFGAKLGGAILKSTLKDARSAVKRRFGTGRRALATVKQGAEKVFGGVGRLVDRVVGNYLNIRIEPVPIDERRKSFLLLNAQAISKSEMKCNRPRRTPGHPTKSHVVKACEGGTEKLIRFGQQGKKVGTLEGTAGAPKEGESDRMKAKRASFKVRHAKNIKRGRMSAAYWSDKVKW